MLTGGLGWALPPLMDSWLKYIEYTYTYIYIYTYNIMYIWARGQPPPTFRSFLPKLSCKAYLFPEDLYTTLHLQPSYSQVADVAHIRDVGITLSPTFLRVCAENFT